MDGRLLCLVLAILISSSSFAYTDSLWIVGAEGYSGKGVSAEVWLQYEGGGVGDSLSAFDILLTYDASVCTVEQVTLGPIFAGLWMDDIRIDNQGTQGSPSIPKVNLGAYADCPPFCYFVVDRGTYLAGTIRFRILDTAESLDSTCIDTSMQAFVDTVFLGLWDTRGETMYTPSFSADCIRVLQYSDSVWIVGGEGYRGQLVTAQVWLQYEGGGGSDSVSGFDIPFTWDATVCSVEAVTIGSDFLSRGWTDVSQVDNEGTTGTPPIPKFTLSGYISDSGGCVERGTHKAGKIHFRVLESAGRPDSACLDTLMEAFTPPVILGLVDKSGTSNHVPSFSTGCIRYATFTDSVWIVGREGVPGGLVPVQVWLQYQGGGPSDSIHAFEIPLTWDATVCTAEAITIGTDFIDGIGFDWSDQSKIDNSGTDGPPAVPKMTVSAFPFHGPIGTPFVERGSHLAATVDFRILSTPEPSDSSCIDTLMIAFTPSLFLGFVDKAGIVTYVPLFSTGCIRVVPCMCGDSNGDGRVTVADAIYTITYIYKGGCGPACEGDVNQDGRITSADAIYLLTYVYRGGPQPCFPP